MDYISREEWYEIVKWVEISQAFREAYIRFRLEGKEVHWLKFNERYIEVGFSYNGEARRDGVMDVEARVYCPDVDIALRETFYTTNSGCYRTEKLITNLIISKIYRLAWGSCQPKVYNIAGDDSEKACMQIKEILKKMDHQCFEAFMEEACLLGHEAECIIGIYGRKIEVTVNVGDNDQDRDFWLTCINTGRSLLDAGWWKEFSIEDVVERILYLALEPECFEIVTTDYEWEYELIRSIVVYAIEGDSRGDRIIGLHGRQIEIKFTTMYRDKTKLKFNERSYYINASLTCITTGKSCSCDVEAFDKNPEELIWKIQELAWEDAET